jgi:hypothetical protein
MHVSRRAAVVTALLVFTSALDAQRASQSIATFSFHKGRFASTVLSFAQVRETAIRATSPSLLQNEPSVTRRTHT